MYRVRHFRLGPLPDVLTRVTQNGGENSLHDLSSTDPFQSLSLKDPRRQY